MLGAVALEVSCVLGLVRHGFVATVYPADAQVILRLPGTSAQMRLLASLLTCSFACVVIGFQSMQSAPACLVRLFTLRRSLVPILACPCRRAPHRIFTMPVLTMPLMDFLFRVLGASALEVALALGVVKFGFAAAVYPADAQVIFGLLDTSLMAFALVPACEVACGFAAPVNPAHASVGLFRLFIFESAHGFLACVPLAAAIAPVARAKLTLPPFATLSVGLVGLDLGSLSFLGPGLIDSIQQAIKSLLEQAVQQSLGQVPPKTQPISAKARRRLKAKARKASTNRRAAGASASPAPLAPSAARAAPQGKGDGGAPGKGAGKGQGKDKGPNLGNVQPRPPQPATPPSQEGEWSVVSRRHEPVAEVELRQQDWDSEIVRCEVLASKLEACNDVFKAVIRCGRGQLSTPRTLLQGSGKPHSVLLIEFCKDAPVDASTKEQSSQDKAARQRVPVKAGNFVKFLEARVFQIASAGEAVAQPKGLATAAKIQPKATTALFCRVSQEFATAEVWKKFGTAPRDAIARWAATSRVHIVDAFKWSEEVFPGNRRQVYGVIRVPEPDASALLAQSGAGGVFISMPKAAASSQYVQWIPRNTSEPSAAYLARAFRGKGALGLVFRGSNLGSRHHADAKTLIPRIWILEGLPSILDMEQAKSVLEPLFRELSIIRLVRKNGSKQFIFRGACVRGNEADLVPIAVEVEALGEQSAQATHVAWARLAPPKGEKVKQRAIHGASVPFVKEDNAFSPKPVTVEIPAPPKADGAADGAAKDEAGKPQPPAKRQKALLRQVPEGTKLMPQDKDGNCMYRSIACALNHGRKESSFHHLELRARVASHLEEHASWYEEEWKADDCKGSDGTSLPNWAAFVAAVAKPGSFSGDIELKALCKLCKIKVVLIPEDPAFAVVAYGKKWQSKTHCVFYTSNHFDYLAPVADKYSKELLEVSADPNGGFLVGGVSELATESCSSRGAGTRAADLRTESSRRTKGLSVATPVPSGSQAGHRCKARSEEAPGKRLRTVSSAHSCAPPSDVSGRASHGLASDLPELPPEPVVLDGFVDPRQRPTKVRCKNKYTFCRLCPWTRQCRDHDQAASLQKRHFATHHPGLTPTGQCQRVRIDFETGNASPAKRILQAVREHKIACHPRVRWLKWATLSYKDRAEKATVTRFNASSAAIISKKACLLEKFEVFRWPRKVGLRSQAISPIAFRVAWVRKTCHATCRTAKFAEEHAATNCPSKVVSGLLKVWAHGRLSTLAEDKKIFLQGPNSGEAKARGIALFDQAQVVLERQLRALGAP
ncbi:Pol, partial [Symbiodinium necroappetens]